MSTRRPAKKVRAAPPPVSERAFMAQVVQLARLLGWWTYHVYDSRRSPPGFLDLVLVRERVVWAETKSEGGELTAEQQQVIARLRAAGAEVWVWRPADWDQIVATLRR